MPKFQRQATHANESDILQIIDERFEELEETVALARLIPQIHDRLFDVEQMLKRFEAKGTRIKDSNVTGGSFGSVQKTCSLYLTCHRMGRVGPQNQGKRLQTEHGSRISRRLCVRSP